MILNSPEVLCPNCRLSDLCLPFGLQENEVKLLAAIVKKKRPLQTDDLLYRQGNECQNLYVVKSGSFGSFITNLDGIEQTFGFHLPGELMGLDACLQKKFGRDYLSRTGFSNPSAMFLFRYVNCIIACCCFEIFGTGL